MGIEAESRAIFARQLDELLAAFHALFGNTIELASRILHAHDIGMRLDQGAHRVVVEVGEQVAPLQAGHGLGRLRRDGGQL